MRTGTSRQSPVRAVGLVRRDGRRGARVASVRDFLRFRETGRDWALLFPLLMCKKYGHVNMRAVFMYVVVWWSKWYHRPCIELPRWYQCHLGHGSAFGGGRKVPAAPATKGAAVGPKFNLGIFYRERRKG